jgi:hypothetical protein
VAGLRRNAIAPDYVIVHHDTAFQFKSVILKTVNELDVDTSVYND